MDIDNLRAWLTDLSGAPQRALWAGAAILAGYLAGALASMILRRLAQRVVGLLPKRGTTASNVGRGAPNAPKITADTLVLDVILALIRIGCFLAGLAVAADIFGVFDIGQARWLAAASVQALAIFIVIWLLGSWISGRIRDMGERVGLHGDMAESRTLFSFISAMARFVALAVAIVAALQAFGFPIASLVAIIGAAGLAIALALQDTLKAVAAGTIIAVFRPYRLGDYVRVAGQHGTVVEITPFTTVLTTVDNRRVVVTNDKAWGDVIENFSVNPVRRLDELMSISYEDDIARAVAVVERTLATDLRTLGDRPLWVKVEKLSTSSVDLRVRAWCSANEFIDYRGDMLRAMKEAFDREGITIPYPHQVELQKGPPRSPPPVARAPDTAARVGDDHDPLL